MDVAIKCICPPKADGQPRHDQDTVTLPEALSFRQTLTIRQSIRIGVAAGPVDVAEVTALLVEAYLLHCIGSWSVVDERGKPVPVTKETVATYLLVNVDEAEAVGDAADELYTPKVVLPLLSRAPSSSPAMPTPEPTSATTTGSPKGTQQKPSKRSSTSTIPMAGTGTMAASPAGASSSSQS